MKKLRSVFAIFALFSGQLFSQSLSMMTDSSGHLTAPSASTFWSANSSTFNAAIAITSAQVTDATSANTANKIVERDASGNFSAGTITATLNGNASTATTANTATTATTASTVAASGVTGVLSVSQGGTGSGSGNGSALTNVPGTWLDVTKPPFNAVGNGVTDDTIAFTNALFASKLSGLPVLVPNHVYKLSPFTIDTNESIMGLNGPKFLFSSTSSSYAITINYQATNVCLSGVEIDGGKPLSAMLADDGRTGLFYWNCQNPNWTVKNVYVHGFGTGIEVYGVGGNTDPIGVLNDCRTRFCYTGVKIDGQAEYMAFTGLQCTENSIGMSTFGGNNTFSACNFSRNGINLVLNDVIGGNGAHCSFSSCAFNHAGNLAIASTNAVKGAVFSSCAFLPPPMYFTNAQGIQFVNCMMGWNTTNFATVSFDHSTNCAIYFPQNPYGVSGSYGVSATTCSNIVVQNSLGSLTGAAVTESMVSKSASYTLGASDCVVVYTGASGNTLTLPTAVGSAGQKYEIKNSGSATVTLNTTSSQTIFTTSPVTSITLNIGDIYRVISDGTNWHAL